jgi:hypothetical protein
MSNPTQVTNSWRATFRTVFAAVLGVASIVPAVLAEVGLDATVLGAQAIAVTGAVTKIMALPGVNVFIQTYIPWLAAEGDPGGRHRVSG